MALPRPPIRNMADFVVFAFVTIVVLLLTITAVTILVVEAIDPEADTSGAASTLLDITTTLIGALVGFIAGKGQGRVEAQQDLDDLHRLVEQAKKGESGDT